MGKIMYKGVEYSENIVSTCPIGAVFAFAGESAPYGYLTCNGAAVSRTTYKDLFAVIGTTYGTGDGSTTFNLPNLIDKFIEGSSTVGTEKTAGLPNIAGGVHWAVGYKTTETVGGFTFTPVQHGVTYSEDASYNNNAHIGTLEFDASNSNAIYGNSNTVQPPAVTMQYIIKAFYTIETEESDVADAVTEGDNRAVTSNAVYEAMDSEWDIVSNTDITPIKGTVSSDVGLHQIVYKNGMKQICGLYSPYGASDQDAVFTILAPTQQLCSGINYTRFAGVANDGSGHHYQVLSDGTVNLKGTPLTSKYETINFMYR